jgi:hypothetical protein
MVVTVKSSDLAFLFFGKDGFGRGYQMPDSIGAAKESAKPAAL